MASVAVQGCFESGTLAFRGGVAPCSKHGPPIVLRSCVTHIYFRPYSDVLCICEQDLRVGGSVPNSPCLSTPSSCCALVNSLCMVLMSQVDVTDISSRTAMLTVGGPATTEILQGLQLDPALLEKPRGSHSLLNFGGSPVIVAVGSGLESPGYTLIADEAVAGELWRTLAAQVVSVSDQCTSTHCWRLSDSRRYPGDPKWRLLVCRPSLATMHLPPGAPIPPFIRSVCRHVTPPGPRAKRCVEEPGAMRRWAAWRHHQHGGFCDV